MKINTESIVVHIPFYNPSPEKFDNLKKNRFFFLKKTILNLKKISKNIKIFVHTHNTFLKNKKILGQIIIHNLSQEELNKGYLTWRCRSLMERQKNDFQIFIYCEHDILFTKKHFAYWKKYKNICLKNNYNLGFIITEYNKCDNNFYSQNIGKKLDNFVILNNKKYIVNPQAYCCMWIYDNIEFNSFIKTKWWRFDWKGNNPFCFYGVPEMSAIGWNGMNMDRYIATVIPSKNSKLDKNCFLEHMTNNYILKKGQKSFNTPEWCKFTTSDLINGNQLILFKKKSLTLLIIIFIKFFLRKLFRLYYKF
jgi:hypothetical protein